MEIDLTLTDEEIKWIKEEVVKRRREKEWYDKGAQGLMEYYKSDDWQQHIKRVQWWASLSPIEKLFTKKPSDII